MGTAVVVHESEFIAICVVLKHFGTLFLFGLEFASNRMLEYKNDPSNFYRYFRTPPWKSLCWPAFSTQSTRSRVECHSNPRGGFLKDQQSSLVLRPFFCTLQFRIRAFESSELPPCYGLLTRALQREPLCNALKAAHATSDTELA
jgi:hypothetical protein